MNKVYRVRHIKPSVQKERSRKAIPLLIAGIIVLATSGIFVISQNVFAADTGIKYPGTVSTNSEGSYNDENWSSAGNVSANDGNNASITGSNFDNNDYSYVLRATNVSAGIPVGNTIKGIKVEIERYSDSNERGKDAVVQLTKNGTTRVGTNKADTSTEWPTSVATTTYGGETDLWGTTWTRDEINASTFGVHLAAQATDNNADIYVDFIRITVYYAPTITYTINASASTGGSISPSGAVTVNENANQTFTIPPSTGYIVSDVLVDGGSAGRVNSYTFTNVTADHTISASFDGGWKQPSSSTVIDNGTGSGAINPNNAFSSDNSYAVFDHYDDIVSYRNFGLDIPAGATINGIQVSGEANRPDPRTLDFSLSWDGGSHFTATKNLGSYPSTDKTLIAGGVSDTWGRTWSVSDFSNSNFRVRADTVTSGPGDTLNLDQLQVKVHYTAVSTTGTLTVIKHVINDNGGTTVASNWTMDITAGNPSQNHFAGSESGVSITVDAGSYSVDESGGPSGYAKNLSANCSGTIVASETKTCIITNTYATTGAISGMKFSDLSLNQAKDQGEPGLPGWTINLYNASGYPWTPLSQTTTDQGGAYSFSSLSDGTYGVCEVPQSGWFQVAPTQGSGCEQEGTLGYSITVTGGNQSVDNDFGNVAAGHLVVHKVTYPTDTQTGFSVTAHSDGGWDSNPQTVVGGGTASWDVYPRIYNVTEDPMSGWVMTSNTCSGLQIGTGQTVDCTIENTKLGSITITKYADPDGEFMIHVQGPNSYSNDEGMHNGSVATQSNLEPGTYTISETVPTEWVGRQEVICSSQRQQVAESDGNIGFELAPGEEVSCIFNNTEYGAISGIKFEDMLANHNYDIGDSGLPNWTINLYQYNDGFRFLDSRITDRTGVYSFGNLSPGRYLVCEVPQQGWTQSYPWGVPDMTQCPTEGGDGYDFTLAAGNTIVGKDFGNWTNGNVSGIKFNDLDGDYLGPNEGDVEEPGLPGWTIEFRVLGEENPFTQVTTEQDGSYQLIGALQPGVSYEVREVMQDGWTPTMPNGQGRYTIEPMHSGWNIRYMDFGNWVTFIDPPVADPGSGTFQDPVDVTLSANAPIIRYTIGDSTNEAPTCNTGNLYTDPIHITQDANLKAIACNQGGYGSSIISHNYVIGWPRSTGGSWFPEVLGESTTTEEEGGGAQGEIVTSNATSTPPEEEGTGEVLGAQTCTEEYLTSYLWYGKSNDATQVEKLQSFMNEHMQSNLPVTGFFGNLTRGAVRGFQLKYADEVLKPWTDLFGGTYEDTASGNVYKTTKWKINMLKCPALNLTLPLLP